MNLGHKIVSAETRLRSMKVFSKFWGDLSASLEKDPKATPEILKQFKTTLLDQHGRVHPLFLRLIETGLLTSRGFSRKGLALLWVNEKTESDLYKVGIFRELMKHQAKHEWFKAPEKKFLEVKFKIQTDTYFGKISFLEPVRTRTTLQGIDAYLTELRKVITTWLGWKLWLLTAKASSNSQPGTSQSQPQPTH